MKHVRNPCKPTTVQWNTKVIRLRTAQLVNAGWIDMLVLTSPLSLPPQIYFKAMIKSQINT